MSLWKLNANCSLLFSWRRRGRSRHHRLDIELHFFNYKRDELLAHYHQRSNVESTVMAIKTKFPDAVRSKTEAAARNEVVAKLLCHNICCLIQAHYEFGIEPTF